MNGHPVITHPITSEQALTGNSLQSANVECQWNLLVVPNVALQLEDRGTQLLME